MMSNSHSRSYHLLLVSVIAIVSISLYSATLNNGFVYDDDDTIVDNYFIRDFQNLPKLFGQDYFILSREKTYRPIVTLTYFFDYALYGLKPWGFHLTSIFLHTINGSLLYLWLTVIVRLLTVSNQSSSFLRPAFDRPLFISLLFISHPVLTEAVNAISFREDLLVFFFYISTMILYMSLRSRPVHYSRLSVFLIYSLSCFTYLLALLSKEMAVTLPLIVYCFEWVYKDKKGMRPILLNRYNMGYAAITFAYLYLRFFYFYTPHELNVQAPELFERLITIPWLILCYIKLAVFPVSLSADYVITPLISPFSLSFIASSIMVISILVTAFMIMKKEKAIALGILFFIVTLMPVYNIIPIAHPLAERYLYLPTAGFAIAVGITVHCLFEYRYGAKFGNLLFLSSLVIISLYSLGVMNRNPAWRTPYSLWLDTIRKQPNSVTAHASLGTAYIEQGHLNEAMRAYLAAIKLNPADSFAHNGIGYMYYKEERFNEAVKEFETAIRLNPDESVFYFNLGSAYAEQGRLDEAARAYETALRLNPYDVKAKTNLERASHYLKQQQGF